MLGNSRFRMLTQVRSRLKALDSAISKCAPLNYAAYKAYKSGLKRFVLLLDNNNVIADDEFLLLRKSWSKEYHKTNKAAIESLFGLRAMSKSKTQTGTLKSALVTVLNRKMVQARKQEMIDRLRNELVARARQGWFVVFNTLTVRSDHLDKVFARGSNEWRKYIQRVQYALDMEDDRKRGSDSSPSRSNHHYLGVVERGSSTGRLHIHVVHVIKDLPAHCVDPNYGSTRPTKRIIDRWRLFWPYGHSMPIAVRFHNYDAYGRLGWQWPVDNTKEALPIVAKPPQALAQYVGKYINKAYAEEKGGEAEWRTRISRGLGLNLYKQLAKKLRTNQLRKMVEEVWTAKLLKINGRKIMLNQAKMLMAKEWQSRLWDKNRKIMWKFLRGLRPIENIVKQLLALTPKEPKQNCKKQNYGITGIMSLKSLDICRIQALLDDLIEVFFGSEPNQWRIAGVHRILV